MATDVNIDELAKKYQKFFQDQGYGCKDPTKDENANTLDLIVTYEQLTYLIILDYDDTQFVRILLPNFYDIKPAQLQQALIAINIVAKQCKGAKVNLTSSGDDMVAACEYLETGNSVDGKTLLRYMSMVANAAKTFAKEMQNG